MRFVLLLVLVACSRPLNPGQTRCTTSEVFGNLETNCQSGPQMPVAGAEPPPYAPPQAAGWWCSYRSDGYSQCYRVPGQCETWRSKGNARLDGLDYLECGWLGVAFCAQSGCAATVSSCATGERLAKRDGAACVAVQ